MKLQAAIDKLKFLQPGLENSNSAAEDAMVDFLPDLITLLEQIAAPTNHARERAMGERHCYNCSFWQQPVTPENNYSDQPEEMGDCIHSEMPIAKGTHCYDWCKEHQPTRPHDTGEDAK